MFPFLMMDFIRTKTLDLFDCKGLDLKKQTSGLLVISDQIGFRVKCRRVSDEGMKVNVCQGAGACSMVAGGAEPGRRVFDFTELHKYQSRIRVYSSDIKSTNAVTNLLSHQDDKNPCKDLYANLKSSPQSCISNCHLKRSAI